MKYSSILLTTVMKYSSILLTTVPFMKYSSILLKLCPFIKYSSILLTIVSIYKVFIHFTDNCVHLIFMHPLYSTYKSRFQNEETVIFTLRVMTGAIILYDHVHPVGAFTKKAPIDVRNLVKDQWYSSSL